MPTFCEPWPGNRNASFPIRAILNAGRAGCQAGRYDREIATKLRLKVTAGPAVGSEIAVEDELEIGREAPGEGKLDGDMELSRRHARIARKGEEAWEIEDVGSRNGTFVNGSRIEKPELLAAGDAIEMGGTKLVVQVTAPTMPPGEPAPEPAPSPPSPTAVGDVVTDEPAEPEPEPEPAPPPVSLPVDIDVAAGEASIALADGSDRVKLVFEDGAWRLRPEV
jgi:pSer/pThr/pTyr-binding forkhead associated (FHA) protein